MAPGEVQRGGGAPALEQQARPRGAAAQQVGAHHPRQRPHLQVLAEQAGIEPHPVTGLGQAHAQLDVFEVAPARVEPIHCHEAPATNGAQARPEGRGRPGARLVHVMGEQIAKARHGGRVRRGVVVGAEQAGE